MPDIYTQLATPPTVPLWQRIAYAPLAAMLWCVAKTPPALTRPISGGLAILARDVVKYRRRLVEKNIAMAFPNLDKQARHKILHDFYSHLADYFFQTVRFRWMSPQATRHHVTFSGLEILERLFDQGRNIVLYTSHYGNWEYITPMNLHMPRHADNVIFSHVNRPLKNAWFNHFYWMMRSRFNVSVKMADVLRAMVTWRNDNRRFIMGFLADQKPGRRTRSHEVNFLGIPTPFIAGTEQLARSLSTAAVYCDMTMPARDKYHVEIKLLTPDASTLPEGRLTELYAAALTETIRRSPALYLWSHNRWRLKKSDL